MKNGQALKAYLNSISSCIAGSLATHELEPVAEPAEQTGEESPLPAVPVIEVGLEGGLGHAGHWAVEEQDVQPDADDKARDGEVEEGGVHHQVWHAILKGVPLIVGGQVECRGEEREAHTGEEDDAKSDEGA